MPDLELVEAYASRGLTLEEIAHNLGIAPSTLYERKKEMPEFQEAIKRGQSKGLYKVANALFKNATELNNLGAQVFYLKNRGGWEDAMVNNNKNDTKVEVKTPDIDATLQKIMNAAVTE